MEQERLASQPGGKIIAGTTAAVASTLKLPSQWDNALRGRGLHVFPEIIPQDVGLIPSTNIPES